MIARSLKRTALVVALPFFIFCAVVEAIITEVASIPTFVRLRVSEEGAAFLRLWGRA